jgi:MoaA/NifB/PqqE/SkfB family radical SAM enzyme
MITGKNANIMQNIPDTFCPAKWDELLLNLNYNYVYSCCKSTPLIFANNYTDIIDSQKENLLNGVKDSSCDYCWKVEEKQGSSRRHAYLEKFDIEKFDEYKNNIAAIKMLEINLGNECNFQCIYCNPKFSSKWEIDVKKKQYKIFSDRDIYAVGKKNKKANDANMEVISGKYNRVQIIGGEPLLNKNLWTLIEKISCDTLMISTNLSCDKQTIDRLLALSGNYKELVFGISIDATKSITEFVRYGIDYNKFIDNVQYIIDNSPKNVKIQVLSLMTSVTIRDIKNFATIVNGWHNQMPNLIWDIYYCKHPMIQSFSTLPDTHKLSIIEKFEEIKKLDYVLGVDSLMSALSNYKFNATLHKEMKHFFNEFASRKHIEIPICLD